MESVLAQLEHFGVDAARLTHPLHVMPPQAAAVAARLPELLAAGPDPLMALAGWERLVDETPDLPRIVSLSADELSALFILLGSSQALSNVLQAARGEWVDLFHCCWTAPHRSAADHEAELRSAVAASWEQFSERLRQHRHREYLRIGLADLVGRYSVQTTMAELSALAAGSFAAAYQWARHCMVAQCGELQIGDSSPQRTIVPAEDYFVVLAMGKLGGGELNFSSDVDVMYLYKSAAEHSSGGPRGRLETRAYVTRIAELITRALQEVTAAGFAFRVDLRLRPDGINGPIVNALADALLYYESYGQTWERTALIQARPIAGALDLGEEFLREMGPFVYRRHLDYATVADMKEMKARVEAKLRGKAGRGNVKLGPGGIREIEFLVQVLQLINGGRDERVRGRGSLPTLRRLVAGGYLPPDEGEELMQAYCFLRDVEHKIQIVHQRQTQAVPTDPREQETLARRLGYRGEHPAARMWADLDRCTERVRRAFEKLFYEPAAEVRRVGDAEMVQLLRTLEERDPGISRLRALGFARPEQSYDSFLLLRDGPPSARARPRRKKALYDIAPALLGTILKSADPDLALQNLATFISSIGARTSFLALLRENPATLRMLVELFGGSQFLANAFIRRPELLDTLVRADLVRVHRTAEDLSAELNRLLAGSGQFEQVLDMLRRFRNQEFLRIGINDLQSLLGTDEVSTELTTLAEVCLQAACEIAAHEVCARYELAQLPGRLVVLGMGKLGGGELNYNSDLDLIFIYDEGDATADAGLAATSAQEVFSKFAQRLITVLQVTTREGIVYRIDTRLRPSGQSGPLVSSLESFRRYHQTSAQVWERQALIKARPVAGDPSMRASVAEIVSAFVYRTPLSGAQAREIRRLRERMERELAQESRERMNIKTGRGGLVDVEFLTQMLQLHYGFRSAEVRGRDTLGTLQALNRIGVLAAEDYAVLTDGYRFLRRVENALRLAHDRPVEDLDRTRIDLTVVARRMGFAADASGLGEALWQEYELRRERIRACYERWFERAESGVLPDPGAPP